MQLNVIERTSQLMSYLVFVLVFVFICFGILLFLGFSFAELLSSMLDNKILGNFAAAILFLLLGVLLYTQRQKILSKMSNKFISILTDNSEGEESEESEKKSQKNN
jgi:uncharacterized protein YacL